MKSKLLHLKAKGHCDYECAAKQDDDPDDVRYALVYGFGAPSPQLHQVVERLERLGMQHPATFRTGFIRKQSGLKFIENAVSIGENLAPPLRRPNLFDNESSVFTQLSMQFLTKCRRKARRVAIQSGDRRRFLRSDTGHRAQTLPSRNRDQAKSNSINRQYAGEEPSDNTVVNECFAQLQP